MDLMDSIKKAADLGAIKQIADKLDIEEHIARKALIDELIPAVSEGLQANVQNEEGAEALATALDQGDHEKYIDDPDHLLADETTDDQNKILGHALGGKDGSRSLAEKVASKTGLSADKIKSMLPMVGGLVMGGLAKSGGGNKEAAASDGDGGESGSSGGGGLAGKLSGMLDPSDLKKYAEKLF